MIWKKIKKIVRKRQRQYQIEAIAKQYEQKHKIIKGQCMFQNTFCVDFCHIVCEWLQMAIKPY